MQVTGTGRTKRYLLYWHKGGNSGLWNYKSRKIAKDIAEHLKEQTKVYEVKLIDSKTNNVMFSYQEEEV